MPEGGAIVLADRTDARGIATHACPYDGKDAKQAERQECRGHGDSLDADTDRNETAHHRGD